MPPVAEGDNRRASPTTRRAGARQAGAVYTPRVAVDVVLFAFHEATLKAFLVEPAGGPGGGCWAFPGGLMRVGETLDQAARRELRASTGLRDAYLEQLFTFGDPTRDPAGHVVSVVYLALTAAAEVAGAACAKYRQGRWYGVSELPRLAYDHERVAQVALERLRGKLEYTNVACNLLPDGFTFAELERLYAAVLGRKLDRRNFRRRLMASGLLRRLPATRRGRHRPAALYAFSERTPRVIALL